MDVMELDVTLVICGATVAVAKVKLPDVVDWLAPFAEMAAKSYVVPGVRPVSVTECAVDRAAFSADSVP